MIQTVSNAKIFQIIVSELSEISSTTRAHFRLTCGRDCKQPFAVQSLVARATRSRILCFRKFESDEFASYGSTVWDELRFALARLTIVKVAIESTKDICHGYIHFAVGIIRSGVENTRTGFLSIFTESLVASPQVSMNEAWRGIVREELECLGSKLLHLGCIQPGIAGEFQHVTKSLFVPKIGPVVHPRQVGLRRGANSTYIQRKEVRQKDGITQPTSPKRLSLPSTTALTYYLHGIQSPCLTLCDAFGPTFDQAQTAIHYR